jgi:PadR family transcriptional regulator, regulatory protein AphA
MTRRLTTTSYAVLGLLVSGPHTAYELAQQMERAFDYVWPRARSGLYTEPKLLVAAGLATVSHERTGRRPRAVYAVTPAGRRAFAEWLETPPTPPAIEVEAILRVMFADRGTQAQLLSALDALRDHASQLQARALAQAASYPQEGPLSERMHLVALGGRFVHEYAAMLERYAAWAIAEVDRWPSIGPDAAPRGRQILDEQLRLFETNVRSS